MSNKMEVKEGIIIDEKYEIIQSLGSGSYGNVFLAYDHENDFALAVKVEHCTVFTSSLRREKNIYDHLWSRGCPIGIPRPIRFTKYGGSNILFMPLLGSSLRDIWKRNGHFSLKSICMIGVQILNRLEHIHRRGLLHLDIKPENLMLGRGKDSRTVYLIDYGLSKGYLDKYGIHIPARESVGFRGTPVFSSVHMDVECEHSPRDDIESMMYTLLILHQGWLPWCSGDWHKEESYVDCVSAVKWEIRRSICCEMPGEFQKAWDVVRSMDFGDTPRYDKLRVLFMQAASKSYEDDGLMFGVE